MEKGRHVDEEPDFEDFVTERGEALLRYAYVLTGNPHDAAISPRRRWPVGRRGGTCRLGQHRGALRPDDDGALHVSLWRRRGGSDSSGSPPERGYAEAVSRVLEVDMGLWQELATLPRGSGPSGAALLRAAQRRRIAACCASPGGPYAARRPAAWTSCGPPSPPHRRPTGARDDRHRRQADPRPGRSGGPGARGGEDQAVRGGQGAPPPPAGSRAALLAAAAVVAVAGGAGTAVRILDSPAVREPAVNATGTQGPTPRPVPAPEEKLPPPIGKVWPRALHGFPPDYPAAAPTTRSCFSTTGRCSS